MSQSRQIISGVVGEAFRDDRPSVAPRPSRAEALALGAAIGFLAGVVWGWTPHTLAGGWPSFSGMRRASLAATVDPRVTMLESRSDPSSASVRTSDATPMVSNSVESHDPKIDAKVAIAATSSQGTGYLERIPALVPCSDEMRLIDGEYCAVVSRQCIEPFTDGSGRCSRYASSARCIPPVFALRFCIDEFEYPNRSGEKPAVMVTFEQAQQACLAEGKRLCSAREWTLACEGPERLPYPNGLRRDATACNIDLPHRFPDVEALNDVAKRTRELERLDQRTPSGSKPACISWYGVQDLVGNVDEWVVPDGPEEAAGFGSTTALKGGYYGPVRARCRPSTPSHGPTFRFYQVGFRCCREAAPAGDKN